ncbi:hypothetical protein [Meiothermus sp.]|jgi:hypothetical protein|uniref:hypothetical protein n=1 Tax=Meiothermus sp. TaxID=1955249 RepID=UPI0021DDEA4C|nr:hypothetical protein [Meiothermus sp.]GIW24544.1 MAG: hypothetical protein KatS3mg069_0811 [Meiothermus sp.]
MDARDTYYSLMLTVRERFDAIEALQSATFLPFSRAEAAAFQGRKIVEAIAFGCLVAIENGLKQVPRDAKGQWNAEDIFNRLKSKGLTVLPSPSRIRSATDEEQQANNVKVTVEGIPERRLSHDDLIGIYKALHAWLHEVNPYVNQDHANFYAKKAPQLWENLQRLRLFVERHFISIHGEAFYCTLWDSQDNQTKVCSLTKSAA